MPESSASAGSFACALACRALASAFSTNVTCGSSASGMPSSDCAIDLDAERREQPAELAQLAGVAGREDEARNDHAHPRPRSRASRAERRLLRRDQLRGCRARPAPTSASISRARERRALGRALQLRRSRRAPVITTFMSVSQRRILGVVEIEHRHAVDHADRHRGDEIASADRRRRARARGTTRSHRRARRRRR